MKKLNELPKKFLKPSDRQINEITHTQKHRFKMRYLPEIEIIKTSQAEILELKNSVNEMKNAVQHICSRVEHLQTA